MERLDLWRERALEALLRVRCEHTIYDYCGEEHTPAERAIHAIDERGHGRAGSRVDGDELKVQILTAAEIFHYTVCDVVTPARQAVSPSSRGKKYVSRSVLGEICISTSDI